MGYEQAGSLASLFEDDAWIDAGAEATTVRVGEVFLANVAALTPVAKTLGGLSEQEMTDVRGGRKPGTLRESLKLSWPVKALGGWEISVYTEDPIAVYAEWDTRPHMIYPRNAAALAWLVEGLSMQYAMSVHHPGTKGRHMFQIGALMTELEVAKIGETIFAAASEGQLEVLSLVQASKAVALPNVTAASVSGQVLPPITEGGWPEVPPREIPEGEY